MDFIIFLILLALGYGFGRYSEKKHYKSIIKREAILRRIPAIATKVLAADDKITHATIVTGSVVISVDYFKRFIATLRNIVGGPVTSYESLLDRARREAILRMKEQARKKGAHLVFNVKLETASISQGQKGAIGSVEVLAYGTALTQAK